jgi:3-isopropylmalate/(R)-2-methylmalate dehydratase small subunit
MLTEHRCWVYGDDVNTDDIFPARYLYTATRADELAARALEDLDPSFAANVRRGDVIVAGQNWGCGSCRDQAVTALKAAGVDVIIAASFNDLYFRACVSFGILPVTLPEVAALVAPGETIWLDRAAGRLIVRGEVFPIPALEPSAQAILAAGGLERLIARANL